MEHLGKQRMGKFLMELIWWLITAIVVWMVAEPLWGNFVQYEFVYEAIMYVIVFITYARYLFLLKYTFLAHFQVMKVLLIFAALPLAFYLVQVFFNYQDFLEKQNQGMIEFQIYFREGITATEHFETLNYLTKVYSFFGMSAIICVVISPFRLLLSFWRVYNKTGMV